jgi:branched-subunit amino acid aminotransferase/4-amino-4-deoxychorismate lyase
MPAHAAVVSVFDRGFAYGDSLFETVKVKRGRPVFFLEHCQRLIKGMEVADISAALDIQNLKEQAITLARVNSVAEGLLRIQVTRGTPPAPGGPDPDLNLTPTLLVRVDPFAGYPERLYTEGMACRTVPLNRGHFASLKSTNLLATILARAQAHAAGARAPGQELSRRPALADGKGVAGEKCEVGGKEHKQKG